MTTDVGCERAGDGWRCVVAVSDGGREVSRHEVSVAAGDVARLDPGAADPTALVGASFAFLLEREPPSSILRSFDLHVIGSYFPEYDAEIASRLRRR